ncbi:peptidylprolyl isomerase [Blastococcus sp. SYSU D00669]
MRARTALGVAALLLAGLTGCSDTVVGSASPSGSGGPPGSSTAESSGGSGTVSCEWTPDRGPSAVDADEPGSTVPAEGTADLLVTTGQGDLTLTLDRAGAPCAAAALVALAEQGFFDGSPCHRETDSPGLQVLQCGDPTGTGTGGPTWAYPTDVDGSESYPRGTVAMANAADGFDGSQFFLVWGEARLSPDYTVVGTVDDAGLEVLDEIAANGNDGSNGPGDGAPNEPVTISTMTVR